MMKIRPAKLLSVADKLFDYSTYKAIMSKSHSDLVTRSFVTV